MRGRQGVQERLLKIRLAKQVYLYTPDPDTRYNMRADVLYRRAARGRPRRLGCESRRSSLMPRRSTNQLEVPLSDDGTPQMYTFNILQHITLDPYIQPSSRLFSMHSVQKSQIGEGG